LTVVGKFHVCGACGHTALLPPAPAAPAPLPGLERLPSLLALPLHDYASTTQPVLKLHRLCDAVEILTRFSTTVALAEVRILHPETGLPEKLLEELRPNIERPTLGRWLHMLHALLDLLRRPDPLVVHELPDFVQNRLLSAFPRDSELLERNLLELRNTLVHGGGMTCTHAGSLLQAWDPWLTETVRQLSFCDGVTVCHFDGTRAVRLAGPTTEAGAEVLLAADLRLALGQRRLAGHVLLLREGRWLDLWPLCDYARARTMTAKGLVEEERPAPLVYYRAEPTRLLYAALGVDLPQGERADMVAEFRLLFRLQERRQGPAVQMDYEEEVRRDADGLLGRKDDLQTAKDALKATQQGVLWLTGPGGIGKSFLLARLARDLGNDPKRCCRIVWRFRASDADRCNRIAFYRHAITRLAAWEPLGRPDVQPHPDSSRLAGQLADLLESAGRLSARGREPAPPRVLLLLDGMDEIARVDASFAEVPFQFGRPNVVWVCAGRPEADLNQVFAEGRCGHLFRDGLPKMSTDDIRGLLLDRLGKHKYRLLDLDEERDGRVGNVLVEAVVERAAGLPLYVHHLVEDILAGHFEIRRDLAGRLPHGLEEYYDDLLNRHSVGWLQALRTPLLAAVAWAEAPPEEELLELLMVRRTVLDDTPDASRQLRECLEALRSMLRPVALPGGRVGYEPNHLTFRDHVRQDRSGRIGNQNPLARKEFCKLTCAWVELPAGHAAREYVLRHGPEHLLLEGWQAELYRLARGEAFLKAQQEELPAKPEAPLRTLLAALQLAMERDDAPAMAEFCLGHVRRLLAVREESPLEALQSGSLERALNLAGLYEPERRVLWYLLLLWALRDAGDAQGAREVKERLVRDRIPRLTYWQGEYGAYLLVEAVDCQQELFREMQQRLMGDDDSLLRLGHHLTARKEFTASLQAAWAIQDEGTRAKALSAVAQAQAQAGLHDLARLTFQQALQTARNIQDEEERANALSRVAKAQAQAGLHDLALQTARDIQDAGPRARALSAVAQAQAQARLQDLANLTFQQALQTARNIHGEWTRAYALRVVAQAQAQAGLHDLARLTFQQALQTARDIQDKRLHALALLAVAQEQAEAGMHDLALQTARAIQDAGQRARALSAVAQSQAQAGLHDLALQTARDIQDEEQRAKALSAVAEAQAQVGLLELARLTFQHALQTARDIQYGVARARVLLAVAQAQAQVGLHNLARLTFQQALQTARDIQYGLQLARAVSAVAQVQAQAGLHDLARLAFQQALQTAQDIQDGLQRAKALSEVAQAQTQARMQNLVRLTFQQALQTARDIQDSRQRAQALLAVARAQARVGLHDLALQTARDIQDEWRRSRALSAVAEAQAQAGLHDLARLTFQQALQTARDIQDAGDSARALSAVAEAQAQAGMHDLALQTARDIQDTGESARALSAVAQAQAEAGMHDLALQTARAIQDADQRAYALSAVAQSQAQAGLHDIALQTARDIQVERQRAWALSAVAQAQARAGLQDLALQTARDIQDHELRAKALSAVALAQAQVGLHNLARLTFHQALQTARDIQDERQRTEALSAVARAQARTGNSDSALDIIQSILISANKYLVALAEIFAEQNDRPHFKRLLPLAAHHLDAAFRMCGLLAKLYPQHASAIARVLTP